MHKFRFVSLMFLVMPVFLFTGVPDGHAIGHYGIPGTYLGGCDVCHDFVNGEYAPVSGNLRWVRDEIEWPVGTVHSNVKYTQESSPLPADGTMADGDPLKLDGPCEVCHLKANVNYHSGDIDDGKVHLDGQKCTTCHPHFTDDMVNYFEPRFIGTQSHTTHFTDLKGPCMQVKRPDDYCTFFCHLDTDYSRFNDGEPLATTGVCDVCHSPDGRFDGSTDGKLKWEDGVYESNGYQLKDGNDNWCATCHDDGSSVVDGVSAPNVMGNNTTYGYNVSGHGPHDVICEDCHDLAVLHTDGDPRTYAVDDSTTPATVINDYRAGYRLNEDMAVPRYGEVHPVAFRLCTNCHVYTDIIGPDSNFRDDGSALQYHKFHLDFAAFEASDTDFDGVPPSGCFTGNCIDSAMTCISCHNVHGSPTGPMIRHGELISTPGTIDKVPALDFKWYKADGATQTSNVAESFYGSVICGLLPNASANHVCAGCHPTGELRWWRSPGGAIGITIEAAWTTDLSDVTKTVFAPTEDIRYHVRFTVVGPAGYHVVLGQSGAGNDGSMPGTDWVTPLAKTASLPAGTYEWTADKTIPGTATPGSNAKLLIKMGMYDSPGGTLLYWDQFTSFFSIMP